MSKILCDFNASHHLFVAHVEQVILPLSDLSRTGSVVAELMQS